MRLLEFQAKKIIAESGIPIPKGVLITSPEDLKNVSFPVVLKAQIPVDGRGKAGAIRRTENLEEATSVANKLFASKVKGHPVPALLSEEPVKVLDELYIAYLIDKQANMPLIMASTAGGVDIEVVAKETPERIIKRYIDPLLGVQDFDIRFLAKALNIKDIKTLSTILRGMYSIFHAQDATLVEINPLALTPDGLVALDAKIMLDRKASYRNSKIFADLEAERKELQKRIESHTTRQSEKEQFNFVPLGGNIGIISDGAGTGMLTMDMIHDMGGKPANFCELGGLANTGYMRRAMELVLAETQINVLLISLIGGLTRMDEMAEGIVQYLKEHRNTVPIVVRMCGTKADVGIPMLQSIGVDTYEDLATAVRVAVELGKEC